MCGNSGGCITILALVEVRAKSCVDDSCVERIGLLPIVGSHVCMCVCIAYMHVFARECVCMSVYVYVCVSSFMCMYACVVRAQRACAVASGCGAFSGAPTRPSLQRSGAAR